MDSSQIQPTLIKISRTNSNAEIVAKAVVILDKLNKHAEAGCSHCISLLKEEYFGGKS